MNAIKTNAAPKATAKTSTKPRRPFWRAPHVGVRVVTIASPGGIDVLPDKLPLGPKGYTAPTKPEVLAISRTAPLVPGQRIAVRFKSRTGKPRNLRVWHRDYDCIFKFVKETPKRFYIATDKNNRIPPLAKSECAAVHAVVGSFQPEEARP